LYFVSVIKNAIHCHLPLFPPNWLQNGQTRCNHSANYKQKPRAANRRKVLPG
jgi:hypothetical protein